MAILQKKTARVGIKLEIDQDAKDQFDRLVEQAAQAGYEIDMDAVVSAALGRATKTIDAELRKITGKAGTEGARSAVSANGAIEAGAAGGLRSTRS